MNKAPKKRLAALFLSFCNIICLSSYSSINITKADETEAYDLYIKGTNVTILNSSDILGDGVFSYDNRSFECPG